MQSIFVSLVRAGKVTADSRFVSCWLWAGEKDRQGYGRLRRQVAGVKRHVIAHRWVWEQVNGAPPAGLVSDHLCRVPACVNPAHIQFVTSRENTLRGRGPASVNAMRDECQRGHPFSPGNTRIRVRARGSYRECLACVAIRREREMVARTRRRGHQPEREEDGMGDGTGDLTPIGVGSALDRADDPEGAYLVFVERGLAAIEQASTLQEGVNVLGACQTLAYVARVKGLHDETCIKGSALAVAAERRLGQLIVAEREAGRLAKHGDNQRTLCSAEDVDGLDILHPMTLADHGITRDRAAGATKLAAVNDEHFREAVTEAAVKVQGRGGRNISGRTVLGIVDPESQKSSEQRWIDADKFVNACKKAGDLASAAVTAIRFGSYPGDLPVLIVQGIERRLVRAEAALTEVRREWDRRNRGQ